MHVTFTNLIKILRCSLKRTTSEAGTSIEKRNIRNKKFLESLFFQGYMEKYQIIFELYEKKLKT